MKKTEKDALASTFSKFKICEINAKRQNEIAGGQDRYRAIATERSAYTDTACTSGDEGCCDTDYDTETDVKWTTLRGAIPDHVEPE